MLNGKTWTSTSPYYAAFVGNTAGMRHILNTMFSDFSAYHFL